MMAMVAPGGYPAFPHLQGTPIGMPGMPPGGHIYPIPHGGLQGYPGPPYVGNQGPPPHSAYMYPPQAYAHVPHYAYPQQQQTVIQPDPQRAISRPREGPPGANLFVYHLPHDLTDADLATAFNPFGTGI